jgi:spore germination cell wall hydrolase CwlJ-like protein
MAHYRTTPLSRARRELAVLKGLLGAVMVALASAALAFPANAPGMAGEAHAAAVAPTATIERVGTDVIITGSINLFEGTSFTGTNRALKQDRARAQVDLASYSSDFSDIRARIAALRNPAAATTTETAAAAPADTSPVEVASIDPAAIDASAALSAIDALAAPGEEAPVPMTMSKQLAYAREDLPATTFDDAGNPAFLDKKGKKVSDKELWCMATAIYFEARGESYRGQVAVGQVVMNRVAHPLYPDTICGVVFQNQNKRNACQFSFACDGIPETVNDQKSWKQAMKIAKGVVSGAEYLPEVGYATHYHATYVRPQWAPRMKKVTKIGMHVFYQFKRGWKYG